MNDDFDVRDDAEMDAWLRREGQVTRAARERCPDPDALLARRSEFVSDDVRERLEAHIASCDACARLVAGLDQLHLDEADASTAARVLARVTAPASNRGRWMLPVAAGIALLIGASLWWRVYAPRSVTPTQVASAGPSAPLAPLSLPGPPSPPSAGTVALWTIDPLPVTLAISSLDASRGATPAPGTPSRELVDALLTYEHGDYARAAEQLSAVTSAQPDSGDAWLYLGVSQLMTNRPADAIAPLAHAADAVRANRRDAVDWYRATAEQRAGRVEDARARLAALCGRPGEFHDRACAASARLR